MQATFERFAKGETWGIPYRVATKPDRSENPRRSRPFLPSNLVPGPARIHLVAAGQAAERPSHTDTNCPLKYSVRQSQVDGRTSQSSTNHRHRTCQTHPTCGESQHPGQRAPGQAVGLAATQT